MILQYKEEGNDITVYNQTVPTKSEGGTENAMREDFIFPVLTVFQSYEYFLREGFMNDRRWV